MNNKLKEAVQTLCEALAEDKSESSYYYSWQANIAVAFQDAYTWAEDKEDIYGISNTAAKNFLDLLISL